MGKIITLTESDLTKIVNRVINESIEDFEHRISDTGEFKDILLDDSVDSEYKTEIKRILNRIRSLVGSDDNEMSNLDRVVTSYNLFNKLDRIKKFLNHPIHINKFKDKYGNVYLQARASYNSNGKVKVVNAYVGSIDDFPEGVNSTDAIKKGKTLIRKKLEPIYNIV